MHSILCQATEGSGGMAMPAAIAAGMIVLLRGMEFAWGQVRRRNGNGKPGCTAACIEHMTRLGVVEAEVKHVRKDLARAERTLVDDLKDVKGKLDEMLSCE